MDVQCDSMLARYVLCTVMDDDVEYVLPIMTTIGNVNNQ